MPIRPIALVITLCAGSSSIGAQPEPAALPTALARALIGAQGMGSDGPPKFFIGEVPEGFPAQLVPTATAWIVGGARSGNTLVAVFADSTRRLAAVYEQMLEDAGWKRPPARPANGFTPASGAPRYYCRDSVTITPDALAGPLRDYVRVTFQRSRGWDPCAPGFEVRESSRRLTLPALTPPAGMRAMQTGGGGGNDAVNTRAQLSGRAALPLEVLTHFGAQLVAAGWTLAPAPSIGAQAAALVVSARDSTGALWSGVLTAQSTENGIAMSLFMNAYTGR